MKNTAISTKKTGLVVPLGALYTKDSSPIGTYLDLIPFGDFCKKAGIEIIQLLPVNDTGTQSSPYSGLSAFALNPIYIKIKAVEGFSEVYEKNERFRVLYEQFLQKFTYCPRYDYEAILGEKIQILLSLFEETDSWKCDAPDADLAKFIDQHSWVKIYAVFKNLKWNYMQTSWKTWHEDDQFKSDKDIHSLWNKKAFKKEHLFYAWLQMLCFQQFSVAVKSLHEKNILLKGDMPILMNEDSLDAWAYPQFFNQDLRAGAPKDGENPLGQNWGFPTYNWKALKEDEYSWWKLRLKIAENFYDAYRLDHILGFYRIWAIPALDINALTGHTEPGTSIKKEDLIALGFDENRIKWLSKPHVPTSLIEDITWNHDKAVEVLECLCDRIGNEELWTFKSFVSGSLYINNFDFGDLLEDDACLRVKNALISKWADRTFVELSKTKLVPMWSYSQSTSWNSLNNKEKEILDSLFGELNKKDEKLWKKQADEIFSVLTSCVKMIPCGEDLGVEIKCVPEVMDNHNILGLRVVRWCRKWGETNQAFVPFNEYTPLSVLTSSVHDSSTIRQWWEEEKDSICAFIRANAEAFGIKNLAKIKLENKKSTQVADEDFEAEIKDYAMKDFSPEIAKIILSLCASGTSVWHISPLQDFLYMNKKYWLENSKDERINVPGTVNKFNWTYRLPCDIETLMDDAELIKNINEICNLRK